MNEKFTKQLMKIFRVAFIVVLTNICCVSMLFASDNEGIVSENESQSITISGIIKSGDGNEGMPGVNVHIQGSVAGTVTDANGKYVIEVPSQESVLIFSFIGYVTEEIVVGSQSVINVTLIPDIATLQEVVVIGYGAQKQSDLTGAISSVSSETIARSGVRTIDQMLQGRVAGLQMTTNTGLPGGGSSIQIRGLNSINAPNEPIFVIDGVIISSYTGSYTDNPLAAINPSDIASIEVLKDASATAIYGAQGANGVIIITTKRGKEGDPQITFDAQYGVQSISKYMPMANLQEYAVHQNEYTTLKGWGINGYFADPSVLSKGTDWQREIFKPAALKNYNLSVSGGTAATRYKFASNIMNQGGVASGSGFDRLTLSANMDTKVKSWLKMGNAITLTQTKQKITISDYNLINTALRQSPSVPARNLDGTFGGPEDVNDTFANPLAISKLNDRGNRKFGVRGNLYVELEPVKWLSLRSEVAADLWQELNYTFIPTYTLGFVKNNTITNQRSQRISSNFTYRNIATFKHTIAKAHSINLMVASELTDRKSDYLMGMRNGGSNQLTDLGSGDAINAQNDGYTTRSAFSSFFGRLFYSFRDKYLLTSTLRYDGSSNFAQGHRWGMFPSAAVAWRISEESFIKSVSAISNMKLRIGYGAVGNANISPYTYSALLNNVPTIWGPGVLVANVPNPNVTWETTTSINVGLDLGLFGDRIGLVADVYQKTTDNLLFQVVEPSFTGSGGSQGSTSSPWANVGSMENKGVELTLNTVNVDTHGFRWNSNFVFTINKNKVVELSDENAQLISKYQVSGTDYIVSSTVAGRSIGEFYGYKMIGRINSATDIYDSEGNLTIAIPEKQVVSSTKGIWAGDLIWDDYNHDGVINEKDRQYLGSPLPKFTFGLGNSFSYKGFDLNIFCAGSYGNKIMNFLNLVVDNPNLYGGNLTSRAASNYAHLGLIDANGSATDIYNVQVVSGDPQMPRMSADDVNQNYRLSSRFIEDGSYLRIQNVSLSYSLPKNIISRVRMKNAKMFVNLQNLYTFTRYSGFDPEIGMTKAQYSNGGQNPLLNGIDVGRYPTPRSYTVGVSVGF